MQFMYIRAPNYLINITISIHSQEPHKNGDYQSLLILNLIPHPPPFISIPWPAFSKDPVESIISPPALMFLLNNFPSTDSDPVPSLKIPTYPCI